MANDTSHIALAALHRQMVTRVGQLVVLAGRSRAGGQPQETQRYNELSDQALMAYVQLKCRWAQG